MVDLPVEHIEALRRLLRPVLSRHGAGYGRDICAFCGQFLISQGGVVFKNPHGEGCGYVGLCELLGLAP